MLYRGKSIDPVDLPDGQYNGRLEGTKVRIRFPETTLYFETTADSGQFSIAVFVAVKNKVASFIQKY